MSETVVLVDYGSGNLHSAHSALEFAASALAKPPRILVTAEPDRVASADRVVLPGVGAFGDCKAGLAARSGLIEALTETARDRAAPFMGICVGMQLLADEGREFGQTAGLGWVPGVVDRMPPGDGLKIPHMGWNALEDLRSHPVLSGVTAGDHVYFVHSYRFEATHGSDVLAQARYGAAFAATVGRDNLIGLQFHPEKSQKVGLAILANFLAWSP
ncbi:MAG: imidazole glycerol phosphate synthase subunit HisH [Maricaulaceae bacterium]